MFGFLFEIFAFVFILFKKSNMLPENDPTSGEKKKQNRKNS